MKQINIKATKRKKQRIKINNINEFKEVLKRDGYEINELDEGKFKEKVSKTFKIDNSVTERLHTCIKDSDITYRVNDARDFIDYIEKIIVFENEHDKLCEKISDVNKIIINRIEYEREPTDIDDVEDIIRAIEEIKSNISIIINEEENEILDDLEEELNSEYLYAKDIELLKKMILIRKDEVVEKYNLNNRTKTLSIKIPKEINHHYIKAERGTVEYHEHLTKNIPRIQRLTKNVKKYMKAHEEEKDTFIIDQSKALQDSINIAVAIYDNKEFKAISGKNNIKNCCTAPPVEEVIFKSSKVNKLGKLGVGYDRVNDSEKKILEEIHKKIEAKELSNEGNLVLYSKWEPCPSCYFVIYQFCKKHPKVKVKVKYSRRYGE